MKPLHSSAQRFESIIYVPGERDFSAEFIGSFFLLGILKIKNTSITPNNDFGAADVIECSRRFSKENDEAARGRNASMHKVSAFQNE